MKIKTLTIALIAAAAMASCGSGDNKTTETTQPMSQPSITSAEAQPAAAAAADTVVVDAVNETPETAAQQASDAAQDVIAKISTSMGDITVRLFGDTPQHKANFVKLVNEGYYDGVLFHRVINDFMVQTGDPDSKNAPAGKLLGGGDPSYTIPAEIVYPKHYHKRGALAAARMGDNVNPERRSSGSQFYIVTGQKFTDQQLTQMERQMQLAQQQDIFNRLAAENRDRILELRRNRDTVALQALQEELINRTEAEAARNPARFNAEQRQAYTTIGGAPHLDNQYTVFGEVISGMDVVDAIQKVETDRNDRPVNDVKVLKITIEK